MQVIIKEWPNQTASIITANGQVVWTFSTEHEARLACSAWHNLVDCEPVIVTVDPTDGTDPLYSAA